MKAKNLKNDNFTAETVEAVRTIVNEADHFRNSWFWKPGGNAASRRSYDRKHSHDTVKWTESGHDFSASFSVSSSYNYYYVSGYYTKDGNKTTLTAIRNSLIRMEASLMSDQ